MKTALLRRLLPLLVLSSLAATLDGCAGCSEKDKKKDPDAFECDDPTLAISEVLPSSGYYLDDTPVTVVSTAGGFLATPRLHIGLAPARNVAFIGPTSISAVVNAGLEPGVYDLVVTNPDGTCGVLENGWTAAEQPPPRITSVSPGQFDTSYDGDLTITGLNFSSGATVSLVASTLVETALTVVSATPTQIVATSDWSVPVGAYLVKVVNPDGQFDRYSAIGITNPSGKLGTWSDPDHPLHDPRVWLGLAEGRDDGGGRFLYAVGGSNATGILKSVEVAQNDIFGNLGAWAYTAPLNSARSGPGVVRYGEWVYAIGGIGTSGAMSTIERARILPTGEAPEITSIDRSGDGALDAGTWYYRVSGVTAAGETLASGEVTFFVEEPSEITLSWTAVGGATSYRVYRNADLAGAVSGGEVLLTTVPGTTFVDDGSLVAGTATPIGRGSLSAWEVDAQSLLVPRGRLGAAVAMVGAQPYLYVTGGVGAGNVITDYLEYAPINADGTLGAFSEATFFFAPRADFGTVVMSSGSIPTFTGAPRLAVFSEWQGGANSGASEIAGLAAGGDTLAPAATSNVQNNRVGISVILLNGFVYAINGGSHNGSVPNPSNTVSQAEFDPVTFVLGNFSSSSNDTKYSRYGGAAVAQGAFVYVAGGLGRDEGGGGADAPLAAVEQVGPGD